MRVIDDPYMQPPPKPECLLDKLNLRPGRHRDVEWERYVSRLRVRVYHREDD